MENLVAAFFGRRQKNVPMQPVVDPATIVDPIDFYDPNFSYEQGFKEMDAYVRTLPEKGYVPVSDLLRLQFYALYKQATIGDIDESKVKQPSLFRDWEGYWKVVGWRKCRGITRERARDMYIELLDTMVRKYSKLKWGAPVAADRWAAFYDGVQRIKNFPKNGYHLSDELRARVYAMYKQALVGDLTAFQKTDAAKNEKKYKWVRARSTKPGFDQMRYDEWMKLAGLSTEQAKRRYCRELFREAASYGYVWHPPGTPGHFEIVGDQTSAKTFERMNEEEQREAAWIGEISAEDPQAMEKVMDGAGVKLTAMERMALRRFVKKDLSSSAGGSTDVPTASSSVTVRRAEATRFAAVLYGANEEEEDSTTTTTESSPKVSKQHVDPQVIAPTTAENAIEADAAILAAQKSDLTFASPVEREERTPSADTEDATHAPAPEQAAEVKLCSKEANKKTKGTAKASAVQSRSAHKNASPKAAPVSSSNGGKKPSK